MTTNPTLEEIRAAIHAAAATVRGSRIAELELALKTLLESLRYTPLGIPQIKALAACELALATPAGERVGLTVRELPPLPAIDVGGFDNMPFNYTSRQMLDYGRLCIAAHEAKRNGGAA